MELTLVNKGKAIRQEKIRIEGQAKLINVYKVDINSLYFNDQNGRIATFMAEHKAKNQIDIDKLEIHEYNKIIMEYVKKSGNPDKFKTTKEDIRQNGQMKTGIILEDGRVIDGNRRLTCLKELYFETHDDKYKFFECFVLPLPRTSKDEIIIKSLELAYQFGEDQREDYNPIDKLVDIYHCLINPKLFTPEEYRDKVNNQMKLSDIKNAMIKAQIMVDYLEYIGKPNRYDLARELKLDGPITEIANLKKSIKEEDKWQSIAPVFYNKMETQTKGDRSRDIRSLKKIYENRPEEFIELKEETKRIEKKKEELETLDEHDYIKKSEVQKTIREIQTKLEERVQSVAVNTGHELALKKQNDIVKSSLKKLRELDLSIIQYLPKELQDELLDDLRIIETQIKIIRNHIK